MLHPLNTHKNKTRKKKTPWWNKALTKEVKKKHDAWKKYVQTKGSEEHTTYIKQRNRTTFKIRKARADFVCLFVYWG